MDLSSDSEFRTLPELQGEPLSVPFSVTRSRDRIGVPGWAPILEGLPLRSDKPFQQKSSFLALAQLIQRSQVARIRVDLGIPVGTIRNLTGTRYRCYNKREFYSSFKLKP